MPMQKDKGKETVPKPGVEDDEVACSNELLAIIREQMAKNRKGPKAKQPKELKIEAE